MRVQFKTGTQSVPPQKSTSEAGPKLTGQAARIAGSRERARVNGLARLAPYRTPEFAAKVEKMRSGKAKDRAMAVLAGGTLAELRVRLDVGHGQLMRLLRSIDVGIHRASSDSVRARTIAPRRLSKKEIRTSQEIPDWVHAISRPKTRRDCLTAAEAAALNGGQDDGLGDGSNCRRPCRFVSCRYHLYLDTNPETGSIKLNFPSLEVWEMKKTCALDIADRGGATLEEIGEMINLTRERARQIEVRGLIKLKAVGVSLTGESAMSTAVGDIDDDELAKARKSARSVREDAEEARELREKRRPVHYRALGETAFFNNPGFVEKARELPKGQHRDVALAVGRGTTTVREAMAALGLNLFDCNKLFRSILEGRYRPPRTDLPPKAPSKFATLEFAAKARKVGWQHVLAKKIGQQAAEGVHVDKIAKVVGYPVADVLAVLHAIRDGKSIPNIGARPDEMSTLGHESDPSEESAEMDPAKTADDEPIEVDDDEIPVALVAANGESRQVVDIDRVFDEAEAEERAPLDAFTSEDADDDAADDAPETRPAERIPRRNGKPLAPTPTRDNDSSGRDEEILRSYQGGVPVTVLSARYGVSREAIYQVLRRHGIRRSQRAPEQPPVQVANTSVVHHGDGTITLNLSFSFEEEETRDS